ncbi:ATP adenylyltransferase, partial [Colletotrichum scovillei]
AFPFKRKQPPSAYLLDAETVSPYENRRSPEFPQEPSLSFSPTGREHPYPNPGYLGQSSHVAIFDQIRQQHDENEESAGSSLNSPSNPGRRLRLMSFESQQAKQGAECLKQILRGYNLRDMKSLVSFWRARGANLALAGPFVELCCESADCSSLSTFQRETWHNALAQKLVENTASPFEYDARTEFSEYIAQLTHTHTRWETIGIFLCAVLRASMDIPFFPSLFTSSAQKRDFCAMLMRQIGCILEVCLSIDCLNDLQLFLQYERCIIHSYVDGDQSYNLWRSLGDAVSSTFALGYHENMGNKPDTPYFLVQLRKMAFARIYSADKNVSLFLGRPLRMSKRFCHFHLPDTLPLSEPSPSDNQRGLGLVEWLPNSAMDYRAETRWSALCASIKEEIMELLFDRSRADHTARILELEKSAEEQWRVLPDRFRFDQRPPNSATPFERDFMFSIHLNHLHVKLLLRRLTLKRQSEPNGDVVEIAQKMLSLVVDIVLTRDELANSGTNLSWKVAHYGLPAAGMVLLAMASQIDAPVLVASRAKLLRDLTVLAAEIERGRIVKLEDPNYALLAKAAKTIGCFLDSVFSDDGRNRSGLDISLSNSSPRQATDDNSWAEILGSDAWDSELMFWQALADHPNVFNQYLV